MYSQSSPVFACAVETRWTCRLEADWTIELNRLARLMDQEPGLAPKGPPLRESGSSAGRTLSIHAEDSEPPRRSRAPGTVLRYPNSTSNPNVSRDRPAAAHKH